MVTQKFTEITESASGTGCALKSEAIISVISVNFCVTTFTKYISAISFISAGLKNTIPFAGGG